MVGVLCARVRVEEKQLLAALAEAGALPMLLPPAPVPLPVGPLPVSETPGVAGARVIVDRCRDRAAAAAILTICGQMGATVLHAGLAALADRLAVATQLAMAGIHRPATLLVCSPEAAMAAVEEFGFPATLLPLRPGAASSPLIDRDAAEAVFEHRAVLGSAGDELALVQAGSPGAPARASVLVVDGRGIAISGEGAKCLTREAIALAEAAAVAIGATVAGVELAETNGGTVVWDVQPVPDYRDARPLHGTSPAAAIAAAAMGRLGNRDRGPAVRLDDRQWLRGRASEPGEVRDGIVLSA
jgi:[lysine-biosynthesis-protein LysW]--L-2-aminoadipate ligase